MRKMLLLSVLLAAVLAAPSLAAESGSADAGATKEKPDKDKKKPAVHKITQSDSYLMIEPLYTTILDGNRPVGLLMIGIGIDVPDPDLRAQVERDMPQLRDGYVRSLMAYTAISVRSWRQPDVAAIADRLQGATDRMLGKPGARILLAQIAVRLNK
jgi:flagellar basal body-associated protein FliL